MSYGIKDADTMDRLIVQQLEVTLSLCDLYDKELPDAKRKIERYRRFSSLYAQVYLEATQLYRTRIRNRRLPAKKRREADAALDVEMNAFAARYQERLAEFDRER